MKNKLSLRERIDRYFLTLESRGKMDPIFLLFLLSQLARIIMLLAMVYFSYVFIKFLFTWI